MRLATGRVVAGKVVVDGEPLPDGVKVTVLAGEGDETFTLSPEDEAALLLAIGEAERGETVDPDALITSLGKPS